MSSYEELFPRVEQARARGDSILELLTSLQGEPNLAALGACIANSYGSLRLGMANHIISVFCEPNPPLRLRAAPIPVSDKVLRLATEKPTSRSSSTLEGFFSQLVVGLLNEASVDLDGLMTIYLLHTHLITLREGVSLDGVLPSAAPLGSLTKAHAASLVANTFPSGDPRSDEHYWLSEYLRLSPFEFWDELTPEFRPSSEALRLRMLQHPMVQSVEPGEG